MRLLDLAEIHPGHLNRAKIEPNDEGSHLLVQGRDVEAGIQHCGDLCLVQFDPQLSRRDILLRDGDIVFMTRGAKNYAALLVQVPESTLAAASFFVIRVEGEDAEPAYLAWYLNQPQTQHYFAQNSGRGVHMPVVRRAVLEGLSVPLPSLQTQKQIAELYRLSLEEQTLTRALLEKRAKLLEAACLQAARKEEV